MEDKARKGDTHFLLLFKEEKLTLLGQAMLFLSVKK